jgi:hypothetical protein
MNAKIRSVARAASLTIALSITARSAAPEPTTDIDRQLAFKQVYGDPTVPGAKNAIAAPWRTVVHAFVKNEQAWLLMQAQIAGRNWNLLNYIATFDCTGMMGGLSSESHRLEDLTPESIAHCPINPVRSSLDEAIRLITQGPRDEVERVTIQDGIALALDTVDGVVQRQTLQFQLPNGTMIAAILNYDDSGVTVYARKQPWSVGSAIQSAFSGSIHPNMMPENIQAARSDQGTQEAVANLEELSRWCHQVAPQNYDIPHKALQLLRAAGIAPPLTDLAQESGFRYIIQPQVAVKREWVYDTGRSDLLTFFKGE